MLFVLTETVERETIVYDFGRNKNDVFFSMTARICDVVSERVLDEDRKKDIISLLGSIAHDIVSKKDVSATLENKAEENGFGLDNDGAWLNEVGHDGDFDYDWNILEIDA